MAAQFDVVIRGGTIVDGSGSEPYLGDVAIQDGLIAGVGAVHGQGAEEIDAKGKLVIPGFVDIHTHYDGQVTWEHRLKPSSEHGVTTVVMGNCGVGFAPCKPEERNKLIKVMEGVEDIPELVLKEGVQWNWTTFPEYLNFVGSRSYDADCLAYVPHAALRVFVMGDRAVRREDSTVDDRRRMSALVTEAVNAGALGVSTSRLLSHRDADGNLAPHVHMEEQELFALAEGLKRAGKGVFQIAAGFSNQQLTSVIPGMTSLTPQEALREEVKLLQAICRASGRPLTFALAIINAMPALAKEVLSLVETANQEPGVTITAQVFPRPVGILYGLDLSLNPFKLHPSYKAIEHLPLPERVAEMRKPQVRANILAEQADQNHPDPIARMLVSRSLDTYAFVDQPDYEPNPQDSIRQSAVREGRTPEDLAYDKLLANDGQAMLFLPISNFPGSLDQLSEMMASDNAVIALGDGGAHLGLICDASYPTFFLSYWVRDREKGNGRRFALQDAVNRLTRRNAEVIGLYDRGLIAPGMKADINILDFHNLRLGLPTVAFDLPASGRRLTQKAEGIEMTMLSGVVTYRNGSPTDALPGRLVRAAHAMS